MITGVHALIYAEDADQVRQFFRDTLGFPHVDAHGGWLIFALPPAELGVHPSDGASHHELWLMCDNLDTTIADLTSRGVDFTGAVENQAWGRSIGMRIPGGATLSLYEPRHATALESGGATHEPHR